MSEKKHALITGASRGIGRAIAEKLRDEYNLTLICRERTDLLEDLPGDHYVGDVGDHDFIQKVFDGIDTLDLLVNNAGIAGFGVIQDITPEKWDEMIRTDLTSVYNTSRAAAMVMVPKHSGRIINISSIWGTYGASCESAYSAAKGGINAFTKALAKELAPSCISVNAIAPGVIDTDMNARLNDEELAELIDQIPAHRLGTPEEIAEAVFLLSKMPLYMTGQVISLDGGLY